MIYLTTIYTLQEHQSILTNATVSKDSEIGILMVVYENFFFYKFQVYQRFKEIVFQNNIAVKYYEIWRSELC